MRYVDGYVVAVPKKNLAVYKRMAMLGGKVWRKHGALEYKECVIEDVKPNKWTMPFSKMMKAKPGEVIVISFVVFKSRAQRDKVNKLVMSDPAMDGSEFKDKPMPFDMKRMVYGGFEAIVDV